MTLLEKLDYLLSQNKITVRELSKKSGLGYTAIRNWYERGYENMRLPSFKILCDFFNVTMESMAYDDQEIQYRGSVSERMLNQKQKDMINMYDNIGDESQRIIYKSLKEAYDIATEKKDRQASESSKAG